MNPWLFVLAGGLFEIVWATTLKLSNGFSDPVWVIPTILFLVVSTLLLNKGLVLGLPAGSAYTVWVGIGAAGSVTVGILAFGDPMDPLKAILLMLIIVGVIGIEREQDRLKRESE